MDIFERKKARIKQIESDMRKLFFADKIDAVIVDTYNQLETEWKLLTNYSPNMRSALLKAKNNKHHKQTLPHVK